MKIDWEVVTRYICDICNTKYATPKKAAQCDARGVETPVAKIGDSVHLKEQRQCASTSKKYFAEGIITKVSGLLPPDYEYEVKWLGGSPQRLNSHVLQYVVTYTCPHCNQTREHPVYAPEFTIL
jgi:hypothetical protein